MTDFGNNNKLNNLLSRFVGESPEIKKIINDALQVAPSMATVLLTEETGVGKEEIAKIIRMASPRNGKPLIVVNSGAIHPNLIESELFGHKKGSFTGANQDKKGYFEEANGGTLFLDEVGELPLRCQIKVLRVLQEKEIVRVGEIKPRPTDFRLICATNKNLLKCVKNGSFREDLYYRINVVPINIPPLRYRKDDIPILTDHFIDIFCKKRGKTNKIFTEDAKNCLMEYRWPGNIRELMNYCERIAIMATVDEINKSMLFEKIPELTDQSDKVEGLEQLVSKVSGFLSKEKISYSDYQKCQIKFEFKKQGCIITKTAKILGMDRLTLSNRLKEMGLR